MSATKIEADDLVYAIRSLRDEMGKKKWGWENDIYPYLVGLLSIGSDAEDVLDLLRGENKLTEEQKARMRSRMPFHPRWNP